MPKTKTQELVFGVLMALCMVYGMETYNTALANGGLTNQGLLISPKELVVLSVIVILVEKVLGGPLAHKLAFRLVDPAQAKPLLILTVSVMTVCTMCPLMSLVATLLFKGGLGTDFLSRWLQTVAINFPMALCWQVLIAGPLVRWAFRALFRKQLSKANEPDPAEAQAFELCPTCENC